MEHFRKLEITLVSAKNLPDVRSRGRMKVYAQATVNRESKTAKRTTVDWEGETNPRWNMTVDYMISEAAVQNPHANLVVDLYCKRTLGDKKVGAVKIPLRSLFDMPEKETKSYAVDETSYGTLDIRCSFGEKVLVEEDSGHLGSVLKFLFVKVLVDGTVQTFVGAGISALL